MFRINDSKDSSTKINGSTYIADRKWHHIAAVRDTTKGKIYLYVDGKSDAAPVNDVTGDIDNNIYIKIGARYVDQVISGVILDKTESCNEG